jgi:uncharacterized protein DUF1566
MRSLAVLIIAFVFPSLVFAAVDCEQRPNHPKCQPGGGGDPKAKAIPLARTGQTTAYAYGDDGDLQMGAPWPNPRFVDNGNGIVTDNLTGLHWTQDAGQLQTDWHSALNYCQSYVVGEFDDWRLPNFNELLSLIDFSQTFPSLPQDHLFTNVVVDSQGVPSCSFWVHTSTTHPIYTPNSQFGEESSMGISLACAFIARREKINNDYTLCVRGGW